MSSAWVQSVVRELSRGYDWGQVVMMDEDNMRVWLARRFFDMVCASYSGYHGRFDHRVVCRRCYGSGAADEDELETFVRTYHLPVATAEEVGQSPECMVCGAELMIKQRAVRCTEGCELYIVALRDLVWGVHHQGEEPDAGYGSGSGSD